VTAVEPAAAGTVLPAGHPLGSTYRLQLNGLGFDGACRLVPYLGELGVEVLYCSPILAAAPGSTHGYDVTDPTRIDPDLGGRAGLDSLLAALEAHGMRMLVDLVPNHTAAVAANPWWWDVLRLGRASPFAGYFDIDWESHGGRILLPVLGAPLGTVLETGEISVVEEGRGPVLAYGDHRFPIDPGSLARRGGVVADTVEALVDVQHYRLAYWRLANRQGNYRRFFDVDGLVGMRVEVPEVYEAAHRLVLDLVADPRIAGLRVDHIDGLADPAGYLDRLRRDVDRRAPAPVALVVEKVVARGEQVPACWPITGLTGYEFADVAVGLLVDSEGAEEISRRWAGPDGPEPSDTFAAVAHRARHEVVGSLFDGQLRRLARSATAALGMDGTRTDVDGRVLGDAVGRLCEAMGVYRTYLDGGTPSVSDRRTIEHARTGAASGMDDEGRRALDLFCDGLVTRSSLTPAWLDVARRWQQLTGAVAAKGVEDTALYRFGGLVAMADVGSDPGLRAVDVTGFHEAMTGRSRRGAGSLNTTSTHDSKRSEDVRARLAVLSELPGRWIESVRAWEAGPLRAGGGPGTLPSPHDRHLAYQTVVGTLDGPITDEYRTRIRDYLVKAAREAKVETSWLEPQAPYEERVGQFVDRILAEDTSEVVGDLRRLVADIGPAAATNSLALVTLRMTAPGVPDTYQGSEMWSFTLVDPDNRRPVDFDRMRRALSRMGTDGGAVPAGSLLDGWHDGRLKLHVTTRLLQLRRHRAASFASAGYRPLAVEGSRAGNLVAFDRSGDAGPVLTVVPRLTYGLAGPGTFAVGTDCWGSTALVLRSGGPGRWRDVLTGSLIEAAEGRLAVGDLLGQLPVAVLEPA
jgi:(1->4)-alpha-D-glucan 1-alpha-D-glucosylmutase